MEKKVWSVFLAFALLVMMMGNILRRTVGAGWTNGSKSSYRAQGDLSDMDTALTLFYTKPFCLEMWIKERRFFFQRQINVAFLSFLPIFFLFHTHKHTLNNHSNNMQRSKGPVLFVHITVVVCFHTATLDFVYMVNTVTETNT